jgi:prepilin-type N-terminal cleavage/methylation domain-containing protein
MKKGFSLVEILVSVAIIGILSGIGIQAFSASRERGRLEEDVSKVVQAIRKAQNAALAPSRSTATGIRNNQKICSIVLRADKNTSNSLNTYYTVVNNLGKCTSVQDAVDNNKSYGSPDKLNYSTINSSSNFIFSIPFAETAEQSVILTRGDASNQISKTITVTDKGLIKVEE